MLKCNKNIKILILSLWGTIAGLLLLSVIINGLSTIGIKLSNDSVLGNVLLEMTIFLVQYIIISIFFRTNRLKAMGLEWDGKSLKWIGNGIIVGLLIVIFFYFIFFTSRIGIITGTGFQIFDQKLVVFFLIGCFFRALFAGFCEEIFFRGILLQYLTKYKGKAVGLIISSLIFMIFHCMRYGSLIQLTSVFLGGIALGLIYLMTGSLYFSIGLHFATDFFINLVNLNNYPGLIVFELSSKYSVKELDNVSFSLFAIAYAILIIIIWIMKKRIKR